MKARIAINQTIQRTLLVGFTLFIALLSSLPLRAQTTNYMELTSDASGASALLSTTNWGKVSPTNATLIAPTNVAAANCGYLVDHNLRTPTGAANYTTLAYSLIITNGGTFTLKGNGTNTISNLILNGGNLSQGETGANPDTAALAGSINLEANATISSGASTFGGDYLTLIIQAPITNSPGNNATLTLSDIAGAINGLTVVLAAQNTFNGGLLVTGVPGDTLKLGANNALPATALLAIQGTAGSTGTTNPVFDLAGYSTAISNLVFSTSSNSGYVTNSSTSASTLTISNNAADMVQYGTIVDNGGNGGTVSLTKTGSGTLILGSINAYEGSTTINAGTLKLTNSGSINNSTNISIASGATFDVSALTSPYTLSTSTALSASGTGTNTGTSAAAINGASGGTVSVGSQPIILAYDGADPALYISQGALLLNGNAFTVNTTNGLALAAGAYSLISVSSGNITTNNPTLPVAGTAIASGTTSWISISGGNVDLNIQTNTTTTCTLTSGSTPSCTESLLIFTATVTGDSPTGNVIFMNGSTVLATNALSSGSAFYTNTLPAGTNSIVAYYPGDTLNNPSNSTNDPVTVIVNIPATITTQPVSQTNCAGDYVSFTVGATGTSPLTYQWYVGSESLAGQTNASLIFTSVQPSNAGTYYVIVSNSCESVTSASATLTVDMPPSITTQPVSQTNGAGDYVSFTVGATGTSPLTYQWFFNSNTLTGQTNTTLTFTSAQFTNAGSYDVVVYDPCGSVTSSIVTLQVNGVENLITSDASGTSSIIGTTNWNPATTVAPTNSFASTNDYDRGL